MDTFLNVLDVQVRRVAEGEGGGREGEGRVRRRVRIGRVGGK